MGSTIEVVTGISVTLIATFLASLGMTLQRKAHIQGEYIFTNETKYHAFFIKNLWYFGFIIYLLSSLTGSIFSIGSLPVTLLAPIGAFSLITNTFFAIIILKDPFSWITSLGTIVILVGAIIVGLFGVIPEHDRSLEELMVLYQRVPFIVYFSIQEVIIVSLLIFNHIMESKLLKCLNQTSPNLPFHQFSLNNNKLIIGLIYGACSILISTQGILFAKSGIELLSLTLFQDENQFNRPLAWIIVFLLIVTALLQLFYLNRALQYCDILLLMPINFILYNISCLFNGLVYYNQWSLLPLSKFLLVLLGTLILSIGVAILSFRPKAEQVPFLDQDSDNEFAILTAGDVTPPHASLNSSILSLAQQLDVLLQKEENIDETSPLLHSSNQSQTQSPDYS